jgi:uncharacterized protein YndB with AHSA1/START domain
MNRAVQDFIERKIVINAPIERVYQGLQEDFLGKIVGERVPGSHVYFNFGEWGNSSAHIIDVQPPTYFSYRWVPGTIYEGDIYEMGCTLVEFKLAEVEGGTELTVFESGFASLPAERYQEAMDNNSAGWDEEIAGLVEYLKK